MDATQMICDSILESDEDENEEENEDNRGRPLAKLCILKNQHIPETELPLFLGDNVLGRDSNTCTLPLPAPSISKQHATICISVYKRRGCRGEVDIEALVWDLGSMNGTRRGRLKLTPNVRYALSDRDSLVVADIPCQFVSCAVDAVSAQGDMRTPVSKTSGVNAGLPDASGEKGGDTSTGSKKYVNGGTKARVSLPDQGDTSKTPVRSSCLSFEKTPTQPQGSLVPESDSDSDGERGDRRRKALASDSDPHKSGPTCSTFLSPRNTVVPESEDESPITPSSSAKNRPHRHVSFSKEETDEDVGRQQQKKKEAIAIVDDSEEEGGLEEERAALGAIKSGESGQHVSARQESNVSLTGEDKLPVSTPADAIPAFNMDSDTDVEGEEEGVASAGPVTLNTNQQADQPPNTAQFHMDSDTDVDEDDDALDKVPKSVPSSADHTKPPHVISVIQPEGITMDSDTDVDDDDAAVSNAATEAKPTSLQSPHKADSAPSTQLKDFHLDSDTDVDEEEEKEHGTNNTCPKIDEKPTRLDIKPIGSVSVPAASSGLHPDSDTDDEAIPAPANSEPLVASAVTESRQTADTGAGLDILSDSDTDVEDNSPLVIPLAVSALSEAPQSGSDADTDVDESSVPPAGDGVNPSELKVDSGTDVEDKEVEFGEAGEGQIPNLCREDTPGLLAPLLQNCSTPVQASDGEVEDMQTQAFASPSSGPFRVPPALRPTALSSCSDSQESEDFVVAETQSFILQTRDCQGKPLEDHTMDPTQKFGLESSGDERGEQSSRGGSFQLGLSDSSHLQGQAQTPATESTQAFVSAEGGVNMEETQAYAAISNADRTSLENEATQAYGDEEEPARCSVMSAKEGRVDVALEATQPYISEPCSDSEDETDEDERGSTATVETQQFSTSSTLAMAQTQPMSAFEEEEEEGLEEENPISSVLQAKPGRQNEKEDRDEHEKTAQKTHLSETLPVAATQPMSVSDNEESDDEDSILGPRRRKARPLQPEEEQSQQTLSNSELSLLETQPMHVGVAETQPMATSGNEDSDDEDSIPGPRKRKAKQLQIEDEQTQTLTNSELSVVATQPMDLAEDGESDEEDLIPGPRRRRAKPLQLEETQPLISSEVTAAETQPTVVDEDRESDDEDSIPGPRKRKAKPLQIQEEETQPLTNSEASTVETQPLETKTGRQSQRGKGRQSEAGTSGTTVSGKRGTRATLREEEEQVECSEPPKRQTRGKTKALPTTRGRRGKSRPDEEESEEEEEAGPAKRARGKISMRQQKDNKEEEERLETARNKRAENNDLLKEQDEGRERDKLERERKEKEEQERLQAEYAERSRLERERAEKERIERERKEEEEKKRAERVQKEKEEQLERERKEKEEKERLEREKAEREEKERLEKERKEQEEKERLEREKAEREEKERIEKERKEREEKERLEHERAEREEKERLERERKERIEKERKEKERLEREKAEREEKERIEKERKEKEEKQRLEREQKERIEKERKKKEEKERLEREKAEREEKKRLEREEKKRIEKERKEKEEKERLEREKAEREEKERIEKERKEKEEKERLEREKAEREEKERLERERKERIEKERKEQEEKERLETAKQEKEAKEKQIKEQKKKEEKNPKTPTRSGRAARRTIAAPCKTEPQQDSTISVSDDVPARRTRSRSNSSNSVSSERSASSVSTQGSRGRGRGRGGKRTNEPPQTAIARSSNRRRTVAAEQTEQDSRDISPQGVLSRSSSTNSLNSEISSCSVSSQRGGRGGRQRGRGRKTEPVPVSISPVNSNSDQNLASKPTARGRKSRRAEESSNEVPHDDEEEADSQQPSTTRGRRRANANDTERAADKKDPTDQECASEESPLPKKSVRGRGQEVVKSETVEAAVAAAASDRDEAKEKRKGRKRELEANTEEEPSSSSKVSKGKEKAQTTEAAKEDTKDDIPVQAKRRGRASTAQAKTNIQDSPTEVEVNEDSEKMEEKTVDRRGRGRMSAVQKKKQKEQEESGTSVDQDPHVEASEPKTPTSSASRKRQAPANSSPVAKTPRSSCASPAAGGRLPAAGQAYKVLFTGVVDEGGERVLARLGGSIAKGVADMNCLVTDKVRRTVKFLCAVAKGVPIVTTQWLEKSGKAGSFLPPNAFVVKDPEQEKKFNFCLQESLRTADCQPLLQGYEIHVTKSVKPEPAQMKDIISCSGATFLPKMPSSHKPQTVVISCEEDWSLCGPALSASLPVVTAEFILTGILQQKVDLPTHTLSAPTNTQQPAGGKGRSRKKT